MSMFSYIVWLFFFCGGVVGAYFIPDAKIPLEGKFAFVGAWGAVLGFIYYSIAKRRAQQAEADFAEALNESKEAPRTQYVPVVPTVAADEHKVDSPIPPVRNPFESILPPGAVPASEALAAAAKPAVRPAFPLQEWNVFCKEILKNRPSRGGRVLPVEPSDFASKSALFLPKEAQFDYLVNLPANIASTKLKNAHGQPLNSLGEVVNNAMELVEAQSEKLKGVLPKTYTDFKDELLAELLRTFNNNALDDVGGDVMGRIYEYFLSKFAKNIASDDGVFFTPKSLVKMIVNVLEPTHGVLLDPACGSGGMFVQTGDFVNAAGMASNETDPGSANSKYI